MEVRKVKKYRMVAYPDKEAVKQDGTLLQAVPSRWRKNTIICAALAITGTLALTACDDGTARVFSHGRGVSRPVLPLHTDLAGRIATPPLPIVMDETDAFRIIIEEMEAYGLHFSRDTSAIEGVQIPIAELNGRNMTVFNQSSGGTLLLDGFDEKLNVGYEFISTGDVLEWQGWDRQAQDEAKIALDLRAGAKALAQNLDGKTGETVVAVFYDPANSDPNHLRKLSDEDVIRIHEQDQENLRQQVRDFIAWLKAEGII